MKQRMNKSVYEILLSKLSQRLSFKSAKYENDTLSNWSNSNLLWLIFTTIVVLIITFCSIQSSSLTYNDNSETIAVILMAYHETSCIGAIESALLNAKNPNSVSFFIVNAGSDKFAKTSTKSCLNGYNNFKSGRGSEIITKNIHLISEIFSVSYGVNAAKSELINKEIISKNKHFDYIMEAHAHSLFNNHWDIDAISEWKLINNKMSILTTYPSRTSEISSRQFDHHKGRTMNIICAAQFKKNKNGNLLVSYQNPWEIIPPSNKNGKNFIPVEVPFWSSFFSFGPFQYLLDVKYDPSLKVLTENDGAEFLYSMRLRTNGYKMYAPVKDLIFHNYDAHKYETRYRVKRDKKQLKVDQIRMKALLSNNRNGNNDDKFGFGDKLSLKDSLRSVGVDLQKLHAENLCKKIKANKWHS